MTRGSKVGLVLVLALIAAGLLVASGLVDPDDAFAQAAKKKPRCAIENTQPPRIVKGDGIVGFTNQRYMVGEFLNTCLDPVVEMGSYACLLEYEHPMTDKSPAAVIDCSANREIVPFTLITPVHADLYMLAKCDYTSIPRYYAIEGYAWAVAFPTDGGKIRYESKVFRSKSFLSQTYKTGAPVHYCHAQPGGTTWRSFKYR